MFSSILNRLQAKRKQLVKGRKMVNPIKESRLTAIVKGEIPFSWQSSQRKQNAHSNQRKPTYCCSMQRRKMRFSLIMLRCLPRKCKNKLSSQLKSASRTYWESYSDCQQMNRLKKVMSVKTKLSSVTISHQVNTVPWQMSLWAVGTGSPLEPNAMLPWQTWIFWVRKQLQHQSWER